VEKILSELSVADKPVLLAFNKEELIAPDEVRAICRRYNAISFSALEPRTLKLLILELQSRLFSTT